MMQVAIPTSAFQKTYPQKIQNSNFALQILKGCERYGPDIRGGLLEPPSFREFQAGNQQKSKAEEVSNTVKVQLDQPI